MRSPDTRPAAGRPAGGSCKIGGVRIGEKACRTILSPSGIPGMDYSINPYVGCAHGCLYCYARYMRSYAGHTAPWGEFVEAKTNAPQILVRQLRRTRPSTIFMSSVTDPYQPAEKRYRITRRILEILAPLPHSLHIHTKSALLVRDIDLIRRFRRIAVCFTITTADERLSARLEPRAPPPGERIRALEELARAGIATSVFIGPVIPIATERGLGGLLERLARAGVKRIMLDDLNYRERLERRLAGALSPYGRDAAGLFRSIPENYYQQIRRIVLEFCRRRGLQCASFGG